MEVRFYDSVPDEKLRFAVIAARHDHQWVLCKHRERETFEVPGGHREPGESILDAARRELFEETGAAEYSLSPVCVYSVTGKSSVNAAGEESFGMLYYAEIAKFGALPPSEIERVALFAQLPEALTYPEIQPRLIERVIAAVPLAGPSGSGPG